MGEGQGLLFSRLRRTRFVHAHHVVHWSVGGETSLANLMLLCSKHHALVHEGGFTIEKDYRDRWFFRRPDGVAVPACGYRPEDTIDDCVVTAGEYFEGDASAEVWRASAEASSDEARMVKEPREIYRLVERFAASALPRKRAALH